MRHGVAGKKFGRNQTLRAATVRDLAKAVLINETIRTTKVKAGQARILVDKLITMGKKGTLAAKRRAFAVLCDHGIVSSLFGTIAPRFENRKGGYTRVIKLAVNRQGDNAEMAILELTERSVEAKPAAADAVKGAKGEVPAKAPKADKAVKADKSGKAKAEDAVVVEKKVKKAKDKV
jgi:large subunit ribosomal protein L17